MMKPVCQCPTCVHTTFYRLYGLSLPGLLVRHADGNVLITEVYVNGELLGRLSEDKPLDDDEWATICAKVALALKFTVSK